MHAHKQLSRIYLVSTLDVTHLIKCTSLYLTLAWRAWERGLVYAYVATLTVTTLAIKRRMRYLAIFR